MPHLTAVTVAAITLVAGLSSAVNWTEAPGASPHLDAGAVSTATRSWEALLDAGDAMTHAPSARRLYREAFFRARAAQSVRGMETAAARFTALGDHEVAALCLAAARTVVR